MLAALLLLATPPRIGIRLETPARPLGLVHGQRFPRGAPRTRGRTWAVRLVINLPL